MRVVWGWGDVGVVWGWCRSWVGVMVVWGGVGCHHGGRCAITGRGRACTSLIQYVQ